MHMQHATKRWTVDDLAALPDDGSRYEVVDGELLVTPAPSVRHQNAVLELAVVLREYVARHGLGRTFVSPADIAYGPHSSVQPDVFVAPPLEGASIERWDQLGPLLLVVEVISPGTARQDRFTKRLLYQRQGIAEYWIVDLDARLIERWRPTDERPEILVDRLTWQPVDAVEPLVIELEPFFREITGA
jgi:Uma2 family endonuclease